MTDTKDTKCALLWSHLHVNIVGEVSPCCNTHGQDTGYWRDVKMEDGIWSHRHKEARDQMRRGEWPRACLACKRLEDNGVRSIRQRQNDQKRGQRVDYDQEPDKIIWADIKFDKTCNLMCRHCSPFSSSLLEQEAPDLEYRYDHYTSVKTNLVDNETKYENVKKLIENGLEEFKTTGGEPTAQIYFMKLIDWCIENDYAKKLMIRFTTNLVKFPKSFQEKLKQFRKVKVTVSCDAIGKEYEYIRYPATWDTFYKNLLDLSELKKEYRFQAQMDLVVMSYNLYQIAEMKQLASSLGLETDVIYQLRPVNHPLQIKWLPDEILDRAIEINANDENLCKFILSCKGEPEIDKIQGIDSFKKWTRALDKSRNQDYHGFLHPDLIEVLDK